MRTSHGWLRRLLVVVGVATFALVGAGVPAFAAGTCATGHVCMWEDNNYGDHKWVDQVISGPHGYDIDWWDGDNEISSVKNRSSLVLCLYPDDDWWGGDYAIIYPNTDVANLGQSHGFDNDAESFRVENYVGYCT